MTSIQDHEWTPSVEQADRASSRSRPLGPVNQSASSWGFALGRLGRGGGPRGLGSLSPFKSPDVALNHGGGVAGWSVLRRNFWRQASFLMTPRTPDMVNMMRRSGQNYICWRCLCLRPAERAPLLRRRNSPSSPVSSPSPTPCPAPFSRQPFRSASTATTASTPGRSSDPAWDISSKPRDLRSDSQESRIREQLRQWEAENPAPTFAFPDHDATTASSMLSNTFTKTRSDFNFKMDTAENDAAVHSRFDGVDMVDLGLNSAVLEPGDLVEVSSAASRARIMAICLGNFNGHLHFYTNTGKWFTSRYLPSGFVVKNFIQDPAELQAVIDAIPSLSPSSNVLDELQDLNVGPSRDLASSLIRKMHNFQSAARLIHQTYVERLSRAHSQLGTEERLLSLREIADALLPASVKRGKSSFPPEALYAVYSVVEDNDVAFRPLSLGARHHESYLFFLQSARVQENIRQVEQLVRTHYESQGTRNAKSARNPTPEAVKFRAFLSDARQLIDSARNARQWSPHGMLGPYTKNHSEISIPAWSDTGLAVIEFMHHWAASGAFRPNSRCHCIGASILRALGRYEDALLDATTGWTFLQEIGWIPPWDLSARHNLRLPDLPLERHPGLAPASTPASAGTTVLGPDRLAHLRQDFARSTVYAIDSADTLDVDDGISLEPTADGDYWVHIHVADPASRILPKSPLAERAAIQAQTRYLAGFYESMFDNDEVRRAFSLGPNQPSLTFSARVTEEGRLVDYTVTPGVLRDVVCITPEEVSSICGNAALPVPPDSFEVGTRPSKDASPSRRMVTAQDLSKHQRNEVKTLFRLAKALERVRIENGAIPAFLPRPKVKVSLDQVEPTTSGYGSVYYSGDPYIHVAYESGSSNNLVSSMMQLAGEVAARWCYERDIHIPYRVQVVPRQNLDALRAFTRDVFYPQLEAGKQPPPEDFHTLRALIGGFDISSTPGPNYAMGLDLYTKVTSPLRRYPDLLVHWQIIAALLEEERTGKSLVVRASPGRAGTNAGIKEQPVDPKAKDARTFLPFSKWDLDNVVFPRLRIRERHARVLDNVRGNDAWILQALVRAWHFGENASALPKTFQFTVSDVLGRRAIKGRLDWFDLAASANLEHLNGVVRIANVKPGDVFRVELDSVNVHADQVLVRLLDKIE
ncbi:hypothetical protein VTK26DRAFT_7495 [Humicola hyalothermophila]